MDKYRVVPTSNFLTFEAIVTTKKMDEKKFLLHLNYIKSET